MVKLRACRGNVGTGPLNSYPTHRISDRIGCACRHRRSLNLAGSGEGSRAGIGSHSVGSEGSWNVSITTVVILLLAILVAPVLLIRFRKRWVAGFNLAVTNRITSP